MELFSDLLKTNLTLPLNQGFEGLIFVVFNGIGLTFLILRMNNTKVNPGLFCEYQLICTRILDEHYPLIFVSFIYIYQ